MYLRPFGQLYTRTIKKHNLQVKYQNMVENGNIDKSINFLKGTKAYPLIWKMLSCSYHYDFKLSSVTKNQSYKFLWERNQSTLAHWTE